MRRSVAGRLQLSSERARRGAPLRDALGEPSTRPRTVAIAIGPEGGFSRDETTAARDAGFMLVDMGPRILRTETAALVALALVQARWGDLGGRDARSD